MEGKHEFSTSEFKNGIVGSSLAVQWVALHTFTVEGKGSNPGWGTRILQAEWCVPYPQKMLGWKLNV